MAQSPRSDHEFQCRYRSTTGWNRRLVCTWREIFGLDEDTEFTPVDSWYTCVKKLPLVMASNAIYIQPAMEKLSFGEAFL